MKPGRPTLVRGIRRAWALVDRSSGRRLRLVALYGALIAGLDTIALLLIYALINLMSSDGKSQVSGIAGSVLHGLHLGQNARYKTALELLVVTSVLFVLRSLLSVFGLWLTIGAANGAQADLISRLLIGHARAPQIMRLERNSSETLRTLLVSVDGVVFGVVSSSVSLVSNIAVTVAVAVGLALSSPFVALTVTGYFVLVAGFWTRVVRGGLRRRGTRAQELYEERYRLVIQGLGAAKELQLRGRALAYAEQAVATTRGINSTMRGVGVANGSVRYMLETSLVIGTVLVVAAAGATGGQAAVLPAAGLVLAGAFRLLPALNQVLYLTNAVQYNSAAIDVVESEVRAFDEFPSLPASDETSAVGASRRGDLVLRDVSFRYPSRVEPAIRGVSCIIRRGDSIGIVGPTGSGKSTLLDVLLGFLEPESGLVLLGGVPLTGQRDGWQRQIGYVPQDVYLVDDTLRANVALGWRRGEIDDGAVLEAIRIAGLDDVVASLPEGVHTVLGERGVRLSGGQRQRVGLARALYTRPTVLVLDEATSNLDHGTEARIIETLALLRHEVTMIMVTHRPATVRHCNWLLYLERGAVRATGTYAEVARAVPEFARAADASAGEADELSRS